MLFTTVTDEKGQKEYFQNNCHVVDKIENYTTIYYNGYDNTFIHYKIGDGSWTNAPGVQMEKTDEIPGYTHKITISLGEADKLTCCFNNGQGTWDNNDTKDYSLEAGDYLISDKTVKKTTLPDSLQITSGKLSSGEINLGESIYVEDLKTVSKKGESKYTVFAINQDTGKFEEIGKETTDSKLSWKPSEKGTWYVYVFAQDDSFACDSGAMKLTVN